MDALASLPSCLEESRIGSLPADAFYIKDFISPEEEQALLEKIEAAPKPRWKSLAHRRLQTWPSDLTKSNTLLESALPNWLLEPVVTRLLSLQTSTKTNDHIFSVSPHGAPNHVLINEYKPSQGIMPHRDGSAYHPVVCTVSLGSSITLDIYDTKEDGTRENEPKYRIFQEPRSLLITTGKLYTDFLHGISENDQDTNLSPESVSNWDLLASPEKITNGTWQRATRTSLTYRDVIKVSKLGNKFGIFRKR
ncbi:hypothetical protein BJ875DRAFT_220575 [Amylocarpus encephaloides]|uniref:Fe2OG dioxygenase domain-containing protein n=1 Tax=Amylocarpus encephaloides TaxID=45428 RepID=A0A9P8CBI8_9HELO|nr:hypothetical protein BJ875DRAFT_220575 [Amylocarpus encephaloides]